MSLHRRCQKIGIQQAIDLYRYLLKSIDFAKHFWESEQIDPLYAGDLFCIIEGIYNKAKRKKLPQKAVYLQTLPTLCYKALGGNPESACIINSAWILFYAAFNLFDKLEDNEIDESIKNRLTEPSLINISTGLLLSAESLLEISPMYPKLVREKPYWNLTNLLTLHMCSGQQQDLLATEPTLETLWLIAKEKSGSFFSIGCILGALSAFLTSDTAYANVIDVFRSFGNELGIIIQLANDIDGLWAKENKKSDIECGKWTFPIAYSMQVLEPSKKKTLRDLIQKAPGDKESTEKARGMIIGSGAIIFSVLEIERHKNIAWNLLNELSLGDLAKELSDLLSMIGDIKLQAIPNDPQ